MKRAFGENRSMIIAAKHSELNGFLTLSSRVAMRNSVAIMTALTTDGDKPVIAANNHRIIIVMNIRNRRAPVRCKGRRVMKISHDKMPTCSPLNANICARPVCEKISRLSGVR